MSSPAKVLPSISHSTSEPGAICTLLHKSFTVSTPQENPSSISCVDRDEAPTTSATTPAPVLDASRDAAECWMSAIPNKLWSWSWKASTRPNSMNIPLALQALVQNQVDQILQETHRKNWSDWTHEDLRQARLSSRKARKQTLLEQYPGLLSGLGAVALRSDLWIPVYVLSITIPRSQLVATSYTSDLRICDVVWSHHPSGTLSVTLFNNHLDADCSFQHFVNEASSTRRRSPWTTNRRGYGFLSASRLLMTELHDSRSTAQTPLSRRVALRVGDSVGEFGWGEPGGGGQQLMLRQLALHPWSLMDVQSKPDFIFPFDDSAPRTVRELSKERRVVDVYMRRFLLCLSGKAIPDARATEPAHEHRLAQTDEVLVTIVGLYSSFTPEILFSGVWGMFPPKKQWTIPSQWRNLPEFVFYKPQHLQEGIATGRLPYASEPRFYHRDYLVPATLPLNRLGVNYSGDLLVGSIVDPHSLITTGPLFNAFLLHLSIALDTAIRTLPDLAVELATDILTDTKALPHSFGRVLQPQAADDGGKAAYRQAFEAAWRRLDAALADPALALYPCSADGPEREKERIAHFGMHPVAVQPHVKKLLEHAGAYPPIDAYAESLLLSAPGAPQEPEGTDRLRLALTALFPALEGDFLSARRYVYSHPRIVWDGETRTFVMSASCACDEHKSADTDKACVCWVKLALEEAVASWRSKSLGTEVAISEAAISHAFSQCMTANSTTNGTAGQDSSSGSPQESTPSGHGHGPWMADAADDGELEYIDTPSPSASRESAPAFKPPPPTQDTPMRANPYPSPASPSVPYRRARGHRSSIFAITPLTSQTQPALAPSSSARRSTSPPPLSAPFDIRRAPGPGVNALDTHDHASDVSDILGDLHAVERRIEARVRAMRAHYEGELAALRAQLAHAREANARQAAALAEREEALVGRELALEAKDEMVRARDARVGRLRAGLVAQTRHAVGLEARVRRMEEKERRRATRWRAGAGEIMKRLDDMMGIVAEREESTGAGEGGSGERQKGDGGTGAGGPAAKRKRLS